MAQQSNGKGTDSGAGPRLLADLDTEEAVIEQVREAIRSIEFGSVLLKIHQGVVVGIETSTKVRLRNND
ncbi:MAG: putative small protein [Actinomycetota bacterium]|jgi:hypothetical protein|nr:putative small protein [Actinomycetota bacterium]